MVSSSPSVVVLQAHDVPQLGRGHLDEGHAPFGRFKAVNGLGRDRERRPGTDDLVLVSQAELQAAAQDHEALVLLAVQLEAQAVALLDDEKLAYVFLGVSEDHLVAPRLVHPCYLAVHNWE